MAWDDRDNTYTIFLVKKHNEDKYKIYPVMQTERGDGKENYMSPVPGSDFYLRGIGSLGWLSIEIVNETSLMSGTESGAQLHRHALKNYAEFPR
jgi:hypothetical protein